MDNQEEVALPQIGGEETPETTTPVVEEKTAEETLIDSTPEASGEEKTEVENPPVAENPANTTE